MKKSRILLCAGATLGAQPAAAHSPVPGIEGFYIGLLHPFSTPAQILLMLGLGLLVGALQPKHIQWAIGVFVFLTLGSMLSGLWMADTDTAMFALALVLSSSFALWAKIPPPIALLLTAVAAFLLGQVSIPDPGPMRDRVITMTGSFVGANLGLLYLAGGTMYLHERYTQKWVGIAFRIAAAWMGAIALVMLALDFAADNTPL